MVLALQKQVFLDDCPHFVKYPFNSISILYFCGNTTHKMKKPFLLFLLLYSCTLTAQQTYVLDEFGEKLKQFYQGLNVETHWVAGQHINWETGESDDRDDTHNLKNHCAAFVAGTCQKLKIVILRPPEHGQDLLSNAQFDWLSTAAAAAQAWKRIAGDNLYGQAQDLANKGFVVVAVIKNTDEKKPGQIAFVNPAVITDKDLTDSGPQLIMAGVKNYSNISLKTGFKGFYSKWPESQIEFYYFVNPVF